MPITPTNVTKNTITPGSIGKGGYAFWGDAVVTWGDIGFGWGSPYATFGNLSKNLITPTNVTKN